MQRILVIDGDPAVRKTLKRLFEPQGYTIDLAGNGISGLEIFRKKLPSAVILDLRLPGMSGQDVCREIVRSAPELPIIVLTANADVLDKVVLLEIGARDYVTKPFSPKELVARVHTALRPSKPHCIPRTFTAHDLRVDFSKQEVTRDGASVFLTKNEWETLKFLIQTPERVVSREELLNNVWGGRTRLPTRTVDRHICTLRNKLEKNPSDPVHVITVFRAGYKFVP